MYSAQTNNSSGYFSTLTEVGFALMLIGVQFGTAIRNAVPGLELVNLIMLLSFIFCIDYKNIYKLRLASAKKSFLFILFFQLISLIYLLISPSEKYPDFNTQIIFMQGYIFAIIFALTTQDKDKTFKNLDRYLFYISAFINLVILYQATRGFTGIYLENVFADRILDTNRMAEGGDKTTMGRALFLSFISAVVYRSRNKIEFISKVLIIPSAFIGLYMFNTRATILMCIIGLGIYLFRYKKEMLLKSKKSLAIVLFSLVVILPGLAIYFYYSNDFFQAMVNISVENISNGILSYFGNKSTDVSALARKESMAIIRNALGDSSILQLILGHGFISFFIDIPIIQAYFDLGILGFMFYFISLIVFPIKFIFFRTAKNSHTTILQLFALHYLVDQLYAGLPYWSIQFMPILIILLINNTINFKKNNESLPIPCSS